MKRLLLVLVVSGLWASPASAMRFGIYPWTNGANDPARTMAAVKTLSHGKPFVVHLYGQYTGRDSTEADHIVSDASWWSANGLRVEVMLRYRSDGDVSGYVAWVRGVTKRLARLRGLVAVGIGNEPNNHDPSEGDGSYPHVIRAIARAIPVAHRVLVNAHRDVQVGFNWAAGRRPTITEPFWSRLRAYGGSTFVRSVGWVGINIYPGTWSPPGSFAPALVALRTKHLRAAGLPSTTPIIVTEAGWPTYGSRSDTTQATVLSRIVAVARRAGIKELRWFDLRDDRTGGGLADSYGLLRTDYSPKPAFSRF